MSHAVIRSPEIVQTSTSRDVRARFGQLLTAVGGMSTRVDMPFLAGAQDVPAGDAGLAVDRRGCRARGLEASRVVPLDVGELCIVPRGVEHKPVATALWHVLLFEPGTTRNTGDVDHEYTIEPSDLEQSRRAEVPASRPCRSASFRAPRSAASVHRAFRERTSRPTLRPACGSRRSRSQRERSPGSHVSARPA